MRLKLMLCQKFQNIFRIVLKKLFDSHALEDLETYEFHETINNVKITF